MEGRRRLRAAGACMAASALLVVLAAAGAVSAGVAASAPGASPAWVSPAAPAGAPPGSQPAAYYTTTQAPRVVDVSGLAPSGGAYHAAAPVRHRDQAAYDQAKSQASSHPSAAGVIRARQAPSGSGQLPSAQSPSGADAGVTPGPFLPLVTDNDEVSWFGAGQDLEPPDTQVAVGPSDVVEFVNATGSVWSRTGALLDRFNLNSFFPIPSVDAGFGA